MQLRGRSQIFTQYTPYTKGDSVGLIELNAENMHVALSNALDIHFINATEIDYLINFYKGKQDILEREKVVREDVNNKVVVNYALSATRDIVGYTFGKPIQLTQRKTEFRDDIQILNDYMDSANKPASDQEKATMASICGVSYRGVFPDSTSLYEDEVPFNYINLDPRGTLVAYSQVAGEVPAFACNFYYVKDPLTNGDCTVYMVYTPFHTYVYKVDGINVKPKQEDLQEGYPKPHIFRSIPIIENINNQFRMGHWEMAIPLFNTLNKVTSDSVNDVEQFVNSILVAINAEIDDETWLRVKDTKYLSLIAPSQSGMQVDLKYIARQIDTNGVETLRQYLEEAYRAVVGIPDRKTRGGGGGDTGDAVKLRDGWANMEIVARTTEMFFKKSEKAEMRLILNILKIKQKISKDISIVDIDVKFTRNKTDNFQSKVQAMATLHGMKVLDAVDVLELGDVTTDSVEMVNRGKVYWKEQIEQSEHEGDKVVTQTEGQ